MLDSTHDLIHNATKREIKSVLATKILAKMNLVSSSRAFHAVEYLRECTLEELLELYKYCEIVSYSDVGTCLDSAINKVMEGNY